MAAVEQRQQLLPVACAVHKTGCFMLDSQLTDYRNGWEMDADGNYHKRRPRNEGEETGSQQRLIERARERDKRAKQYQRGKSRRPVAGRNLR